MEATNRQNTLAETEWQFVNATMVQAKTHVPGAVTAGRKLPLADRLRQFIKFCMVGGSGVVVDTAVLYVLADPKTLALNLAFSKVCAAEVALINNFLWNEFWTFRSPNTLSPADGERARVRGFYFGPPRLRRFLFFNAICGIGILFAVLLLHLFHMRLGWNLYLSNLLTIGLVTLWNFGMNARFNWKTPVGHRRSIK
jgi:dolichol-phosphate mannosyltransferase